MAGINKVLIVGRVGNDPETRRFNSGDEMAEFSVATSEQWRDKNSGEKKERTEWHKIKVMNDGLVKNVIRPYVNKGSLIGIEGELQTEKWQDQNGQDRYSTKIVVSAFRGTVYLLGNRDDNGGGDRRNDNSRSSNSGGNSHGSQGGRPGNGGSGNSFSRDLDDDIPFAPEFR